MIAGKIAANASKLGGFIAAVSIFLLIWVFGPSVIWSQNPDEFNFGIRELLPYLFDWRWAGLAIVIGVGTMFLPPRLYRVIFALLFAAFLIALVEFNFFQGENALVGNEAEGVTVSTAGQWFPIIIFAAILIACLLGRKFLGNWTIAAMVVFAVAQGASIAMAPSAAKHSSIDLDKLTTYSSSKNIIEIILDEAESTLMLEVLKGKFPDYEKKLSGFTFYQDAVGLYPTTRTAVGYLFADTVWENKQPLLEWRKNSLKGNMFSDLAKNGYDVDVVSFPAYTDEKHTPNKRIVGIPVPFYAGSAQRIADGKRAEAALLANLSIERTIPDIVREKFKAAESHGESYIIERLRAHVGFFDEMGKMAHLGDATPRYKLLHVVSTHNPAAVTSNCTVLSDPRPGTYENYVPQYQCAVTQLFALLDKLREIGAYDNSTIIVHADHGRRVAADAPAHLAKHFGGVYSAGLAQIIASSLPTMMIKLSGATGDMKVSDAPVWYKDLPATVRKFAGLPLRDGEHSMLDDNTGRERFFYYYPYSEKGNGFSNRLIKYRISGRVHDVSSWHKVQEFFDPGQDFSPKRIDFGTAEARAFEGDYWISGRGRDGATVSYSVGGTGTIPYKFIGHRDHKLMVRMYSAVPDQNVKVSVNGTEIGALRVDYKDVKTYTLNIPSDVIDESALSQIEFDISRINKTPSGGENGIAVDWIEID